MDSADVTDIVDEASLFAFFARICASIRAKTSIDAEKRDGSGSESYDGEGGGETLLRDDDDDDGTANDT